MVLTPIYLSVLQWLCAARRANPVPIALSPSMGTIANSFTLRFLRSLPCIKSYF
ncbi:MULTISPECIES: hypothetical protein [unclassified Microcoleus]|uniref:hypothetical protein n=1 Tax=unclassified Microcoleus TaxID=2642155 RepID=UPI0025EAFCC8|nr:MULTISPECIES: hypothetical protein [unclassified Microcoleus]